MKGILLAGGTGSRLHPATLVFSKQLLAVYDKPLTYYPISVLMLAGIRDILVITTEHDLPHFKKLLGTGSKYGVQFSYAVQQRPEGIAQAFIIAEDFIKGDTVALILGDNIFYGQAFTKHLKNAASNVSGATVFAYPVKNPRQFGVIEIDKKTGKVLSIAEKPLEPKSNLAVTGLYFYDNTVVGIAKTIEKSERGELEITSVNQAYLSNANLRCIRLGRGFAWLDTGTPQSLITAGQFVETIQERQGQQIACLEEIAFQNGWIGKGELAAQAKKLGNSLYGEYLHSIIAEG